MGLASHLTWDYEDTNEVYVTHYHFILPDYTTPHGTHPTLHLVHHQIYIHCRYLGKKCLTPPTDAEIMGGHIFMREGYDTQHLRFFTKQKLILTH